MTMPKQILVNSTPVEFSGQSLAELLQAQGAAQQKGVAVALNDEVVPKDAWPQTALSGGDRVLIIQPAQGG